jgi:hypothetical protein
VQFGSSSAPAQAEMLLNAAGQRGEHLETFFVCCSKAALTSAQYRSPLGRRPYEAGRVFGLTCVAKSGLLAHRRSR